MAGEEPSYGEPCESRLGAFGGDDDRPSTPCEEFHKPRVVPTTAGASALVGLDGGFCAVVKGTVVCWDRAQLAAGLEPREVPDLASPKALFGAGESACALDGSGKLGCWTLTTMFPRPVPGLEASLGGAAVAHVATGARHVCVVDERGRVHCAGDNEAGQLGRKTEPGPLHPAAVVAGVDDAAAVALGERHSCAMTKPGEVWCWGGPRHVIGGSPPLLESPTPVAVDGW